MKVSPEMEEKMRKNAEDPYGQNSKKEDDYMPPRPSLNDSTLDLSKILLEKPKKKKSVAKTFYMDEENVEKLEKLAKSYKISVSKALNEIIEKLL